MQFYDFTLRKSHLQNDAPLFLSRLSYLVLKIIFPEQATHQCNDHVRLYNEGLLAIVGRFGQVVNKCFLYSR